jgi:uncharacterized membrane protein YvbJ
MPPEICPNCGAEVPPRAKACPGCGSDEETGWSEQARYDALDLPDENFDYQEFTNREFGSRKSIPRGIHGFWWLVAVVLVLGLLMLWLL